MVNKKIQFILKRREDYNPFSHSKNGLSTGLYNSAFFMNEMMKDLNYSVFPYPKGDSKKYDAGKKVPTQNLFFVS